ncbi:protein of unknown function DUF1573 [Chthoniobacter flavus Ellin428]|uniref:DUF1573 domain-containing protein n=1 Tax=Chthoniobacter flavus Ellin428 TaxID=497964 RepID=B4CV63_9BACT|nr:DUF1573 domain-containing protein [Chthoniobacter flavus]EDY22451.1 protein of unknown function DUF1573 [Chthoniobacter flavus Ellin428]TCO94540.1 uncharacterized protein DUF1573 [Chthoniobacter flavus]
MRFIRLLPLLALSLSFLGARASAELKWDHPVQTFHRVPEDKEIDAHFPFKNVGATPVTIKTVRTSCGCTTAHLEKKTYAPGETGEVVLHFTFGDRKGAYRKSATVTIDDKAIEPYVIGLIIDIHDPVTMTPALVYWKKGDPTEARNVQFTVEAGQPVHIKSVTSSNPRLAAKLETTKAGEQYAISVTPTDTAQKESAEISIQTDFPSDAPRAYTIHARIK